MKNPHPRNIKENLQCDLSPADPALSWRLGYQITVAYCESLLAGNFQPGLCILDVSKNTALIYFDPRPPYNRKLYNAPDPGRVNGQHVGSFRANYDWFNQ